MWPLTMTTTRRCWMKTRDQKRSWCCCPKKIRQLKKNYLMLSPRMTTHPLQKKHRHHQPRQKNNPRRVTCPGLQWWCPLAPPTPTRQQLVRMRPATTACHSRNSSNTMQPRRRMPLLQQQPLPLLASLPLPLPQQPLLQLPLHPLQQRSALHCAGG